ncbi:MAG: aminotransferase class I/II-fold pyridoxal phosphate-dependent enzyme, partial [Verrucomicrobiales bacterium]|nr:aminotransferase class I/II-fold pyridoxal phosphate-dependent enzyme [Verrucomicrobiales bacterium]
MPNARLPALFLPVWVGFIHNARLEAFETFLQRTVADWDSRHLRRAPKPCRPETGCRVATPRGPRRVFSSNDYLGLSRHPAVRAAAAEAARSEGAGAGAARLVCGTFEVHERLERALAAFKGTERALTFASGYATALGVVPALVGPGDCVVLDRLAHACLVDAARLSGARLRVFRHNDVDDLERILTWADVARHRGFHDARGSDEVAPETEGHSTGESGRVLVVTESVFSMDGDRAPLTEIVEAKTRHDAWLLVDEAHATGIAGARRRGGGGVVGGGGGGGVPRGTRGEA